MLYFSRHMLYLNIQKLLEFKAGPVQSQNHVLGHNANMPM